MIGIKVKTDDKYAYITLNYRHIIENDWLDDLQYLCEPTELHEKRVTVGFATSNSIMREFTRHRSMSFAVESTRYCNYSRDKFGNELTFIIPSWLKEFEEGQYQYRDVFIDQKWMGPNNTDISYEWLDPSGCVTYPSDEEHFLLKSLEDSEKAYLKLIELGAKPQEAREVLPLATKCDMVMTGFVSDWQHLFQLRSSIAVTGKPHPDMVALVDPLMQEFINRNYIKK